MKRFFTVLAGAILMFNISAQTFSDNFDSYTSGDYIGVVGTDWTTWSGTTGGSEDAKVTDANASTAPNSIYFQSTSADGGPQDVVLNFGGEYNVGQFTYESSFFVETGNGAYFNFQAKEKIGTQWALDFHMVNDGNYYIVSDGKVMFSGTYPVNAWFDLKIDIDLSINKWSLYFDDVLEGSWANAINQVASIDIFPVNGSSVGGNGKCSFYVDNVSYNVVEYTLPTLNGAIILVDSHVGLPGQERYVTATLRNLGTTGITSCDLTLDYNGVQVTETIKSTYVTSTKTKDYTFASPITLVEGANPCVVTISNLNGTGVADDDTSDDAKTLTIDPVIPAPGKIVLSEEGTGTWCQWCPRGAVAMERMEDYFHGYWAGVAVHNGDPMQNDDYALGLNDYVAGYPSALVDRGSMIDPSQMEIEFLKNIVIAPTGVVTNGATYNNVTGALEISAKIDWKAAVAGNWKIACVLTENAVTGSDAGYGQANAYAGGNYGPMGGYEMLPATVPADDMEYNHVGRRILPGYDGALIEGVEGAVEGDTKVVYFSTTIETVWNSDKMSIIVMLIKPDGSVDNVGYATLAEAIENGVVGIDTEESASINTLKMYPNPSNGTTYLQIDNVEANSVQVMVVSANGQMVSNKVYASLNKTIALDTKNYAKGIYMVQVVAGNVIYSEKLIVE